MDELNCRACGYRTCRDYAVAVHQGLADLEMCLPHNLQQLEEDRGRLIQKYELARRELDMEYGDEFIVGTDRKTLEVLDLIKQVGPTPTTVLIRGESGTGKELTARAIHRYSKRNDKPLVTVNCTTITDSLLESELFGHRKGAFTGAVADKKGLFEAADGGTIFLDEIGDITPKLQAELLRVLDTGDVRPVGGTHARKVDVRLIAATNKNLEQGVKEGWFREDLYYRLNVFTITMPPLRSRVESIPAPCPSFPGKGERQTEQEDSRHRRAGHKSHGQLPLVGQHPRIAEHHWSGRRSSPTMPSSGWKTCPRRLPSTTTRRPRKGIDGQVSFLAARERHVLKVEKELLQRYLVEAGGNVTKAAQLGRHSPQDFLPSLGPARSAGWGHQGVAEHRKSDEGYRLKVCRQWHRRDANRNPGSLRGCRNFLYSGIIGNCSHPNPQVGTNVAIKGLYAAQYNNQQAEGTGREPMGRMRENTKNNVISMRISDAEMVTLEQIMNVTHKSVSDIMREAMELLKTIPFESLGMAVGQADRQPLRANPRN